jgi:hypothetical protein
MTCKHLANTSSLMPPEIGGPLTPQTVRTSECKLGRNPNIIGWITKCSTTADDGPCWFWTEVHGDVPDTEFSHRK